MGKLGLIALGQTPRPDFMKMFHNVVLNTEIVVTGALDGVSDDEIMKLSNASNTYLLYVVLSDGTIREIALDLLLPYLKSRVAELAAAGVEIAIVMCAGNFPDLGGSIPIIYPGRVISALVGAVSPSKKIGVIVPNKGQMQSAVDHWEEAGFNIKAVAISPQEFMSLNVCPEEISDLSLDLIILDCMGFTAEMSSKMEILSKRPTICHQRLIPHIAEELLTSSVPYENKQK